MPVEWNQHKSSRTLSLDVRHQPFPLILATQHGVVVRYHVVCDGICILRWAREALVHRPHLHRAPASSGVEETLESCAGADSACSEKSLLHAPHAFLHVQVPNAGLWHILEWVTAPWLERLELTHDLKSCGSRTMYVCLLSNILQRLLRWFEQEFARCLKSLLLKSLVFLLDIVFDQTQAKNIQGWCSLHLCIPNQAMLRPSWYRRGVFACALLCCYSTQGISPCLLWFVHDGLVLRCWQRWAVYCQLCSASLAWYLLPYPRILQPTW